MTLVYACIDMHSHAIHVEVDDEDTFFPPKNVIHGALEMEFKYKFTNGLKNQPYSLIG